MKRIENVVALVIILVFTAFGLQATNNKDTAPPIKEDIYEAHFLDVGQGDAILLERGNHQVLIDGGPDNSVLQELGAVMPVEDKTIEVVILTHPHADHLRGLLWVLKSYQINKVFFNGVSYNTPEYREFLTLVKSNKIPTEIVFQGKEIDIPDAELNVLWPPKDLKDISDINDSSIVLQVDVEGQNLLLLGDISTTAQKHFLNELLPVDILKVSHHGSNTGTNNVLLQATKPEYSVITVGKNSYGHPTANVLSLLRGTKILRTDKQGTISFGIDTEGVFLY